MTQQQAVLDQITNLTVSIFRFVCILYADDRSSIKASFDTLLKLHEVM